MNKLLIIASLFLIACGPSKEELDAQKKANEESKNQNSITVKTLYCDNSYRVIELDKCQYVILRGCMMLHKANCPNHQTNNLEITTIN